MGEGRADEAAAVLLARRRSRPARLAARGRRALEVGDRGSHRGVVGAEAAVATSGVPSAQSSDTDFGADRVRSKPGPLDPAGRQRLAGPRVLLPQQRAEVVGPDGAAESEPSRLRWPTQAPGASLLRT